MSSDGSFLIKGRIADAIRYKVQQRVVYPGPIEQAVSTHESFSEIKVEWFSRIYCLFMRSNAENLKTLYPSLRATTVLCGA